MTLRDHLSPNQKVDASRCELHDDLFETAAATRSVTIQACDSHSRIKVRQPSLELFGAEPDVLDVLPIASVARTRNWTDVSAIVTLQAAVITVVRQRHIAIWAGHRKPARPAQQKGRESSAI